ncbi:helicase [Bacillus pseudomycoides]|nr:helicase [Bacillus pseudomycoides]
MKYNISNQAIPQEARKEINDKILYLIDNNLTAKFNINNEDVFNSYTGDGGLHNLQFKNYNSFHAYTEAKKEIEQGQFFTPHILSKFLVDCLKPTEHDLVIDLTCGMGNFFNYLPNEINVYGNELDIKAYKVAKHLYPNANITNQDIRSYKTDVSFDIVLGNPPFNLKWKVNNNEYLSQLYYCMKSYEVLKPAGIMALIVPKSFLNDTFIDSGMIKEINNMFNFICQFELPSNAFKNLGVENFNTKIMIFQKKSEHVQDKPYTNEYIQTSFNDCGSQFIYNNLISPLLQEKQEIKNKIILESMQQTNEEKEFQYKVNKLLFDIKRNNKINKHYSKAYNYYQKLYTQKQPDGMPYEEWQKVRITKNKVIRYLKDMLNKQHKKEIDKTALVKTRYGLRLKAYSHKEKLKLSKVKNVKEISFNDMIIKNDYPFSDNQYKKLLNKKIRHHEKQDIPFSEIACNDTIKTFLDDLIIKNLQTHEQITLNDIQKQDTAKMLSKSYGYLQWGTGAGKSISAIAQMLYRQQHNNIRNIFLVAPAIAINNNWDDILEAYGIDYIRINSLKDIHSIKRGQIVIMTFGMLTKYQKQIKKYIRMQSQKVMLVLDEADNISNPSSKRTKAVLNCFRRVKYKLLMSATSTRNNIPESFTAFELLYNNSINMLSKNDSIYKEDQKSKQLIEKQNDNYMKPFPAYKKGYTLFKRSFSPEKATVFGVGKQNQDIYNSEELKELIDKTMITRTFQEVSGKNIYKIIQDTCTFNKSEEELYRIVIEEFYRLTYLHKTTGNSRKDTLLRIIQQLNSLLKACVIPNTFKEYVSSIAPSKAAKTLEMLNKWNNDQVVIGCTHIKTVDMYANYIRNHFSDRELFIITGDSTTLNKRKDIINKLKKTKNGILICTQQSLSSSMNIDFVNKVLLIELQWNFAAMHQFFARFVRYTSMEQKEIHFLTIENSIESNLLKLIMNKEKLNNFMKNDTINDAELSERFGIDFDILNMLLSKEIDQEGKSYISWGKQKIV